MCIIILSKIGTIIVKLSSCFAISLKLWDTYLCKKSLDNGLQSTSQAVCQFLNGFLFSKSLAKRLHWGSNPKSSLHTSLQQLLNV